MHINHNPCLGHRLIIDLCMTCFLILLRIFFIFGVRWSTKHPRKGRVLMWSTSAYAAPATLFFLVFSFYFPCFRSYLHLKDTYMQFIGYSLFHRKTQCVCDVWNLGESPFHLVLNGQDDCSLSRAAESICLPSVTLSSCPTFTRPLCCGHARWMPLHGSL